MAIPSTIPSNYCPQFSNVGDYPIAVTLGANPNYSVVSTNGILSGDESPPYCCVVTGAVNGDTINYLLPLNSLMLGTILLL
jgi:hypothetical protein